MISFSTLIKQASEIAQKSEHKQRVGAVIYKNRYIISKGYNTAMRSVRSISKQFLKMDFSIHAEVAAIIKARRTLKGYDILVVRINNGGELRNARPCEYCLGYLDYVGINNIYYSTNLGIIEKV